MIKEGVSELSLERRSLSDLMARLSMHSVEHLRHMVKGELKQADYETIRIDTVNKEITARSLEERNNWFSKQYKTACEYKAEGANHLSKLLASRLNVFKRDFLQDSEYRDTDLSKL